MPSNRTPTASVEQSAPSKVLILTSGDISPTVMRQFEHACMNYFIHKKVVPDDQVSWIISRLMDNRVTDWIGSDRKHIVSLPFTAFMVEFCLNYLAEDWEEDTFCELLSMTQGTSSFWDYAIVIQSKNSLLWDTVLTPLMTSCIISLGLVWKSGCQRRFPPKS
jgi:hypothetical protein